MTKFSTKTVLAFDVSFQHIGWAEIIPHRDSAVIRSVGCIDNKSDIKRKKELLSSNYTADRIMKVYKELFALYEEKQPSCIIAELPTGGAKSNKAAAAMAAATAIVVCFVTQAQAPAAWTTPDQGKLALCGCRTAGKLEMQAAAITKFPELRTMVKKSGNRKSQSGLEGWFEHAADAIAAYLASKDGPLIRFIADHNGLAADPDPTLF